MSNANKRIAGATARAHVNNWQHLEGKELLEAVIKGPLAGRVAVSSSFGAETAVLLDLVAEVDPTTPVIFLDTKMLFDETLSYRDELTQHLGLSDVRTIVPNKISVNNADPNGDLHILHPDVCCNVRKVMPHDEAMSNFDVVITGRKGFHGGERSNLKTAEIGNGQIKINPLADWSENQIEERFLLKQLPRHPLTSQGYRSIGCGPCTHKVSPDEDVRAGRWCKNQKTECGIHRQANNETKHSQLELRT